MWVNLLLKVLADKLTTEIVVLILKKIIESKANSITKDSIKDLL